MNKLSIIQRTLIVQLYIESNCSVVRTRTQRAFVRNTGNRNHPSPCCIRLIVAKLKALGTVADREHPGRSRTVRGIDNIESVRQKITHNPHKSVRRRSEEPQISKTFLWCIFSEDLKHYPYEIQLGLKIGQNDCEKRLQFALSIIEIFQIEENKLCVDN